jgi:hypothetical protein
MTIVISNQKVPFRVTFSDRLNGNNSAMLTKTLGSGGLCGSTSVNSDVVKSGK